MYYQAGYNQLIVKLNGLIRELIWCLTLPNVIYNSEFPKCGGTWLAKLISEMTNTPFFRNKIPSFSKQIILGHRIKHKGMNVIRLVRNPFDVCVSFYFYVNDVKRSEVSLIQKRIINLYGEISIDTVIDYLFVQGLPRIGLIKIFISVKNLTLLDMRI